MINRSFSYIGNDALNTVSHYNADVVFFSCRGLSLDGFASDNSIEENQIRMAMMKQSAKKILLCDSSKVGKTYLHNLCHVSEVDEVICETALPQFRS